MGTGKNIIVHVCTPNRWGKRYGAILLRHYPMLKDQYALMQDEGLQAGHLLNMVQVDDTTHVAVMIAIDDGTILRPATLNRSAYMECLSQLGPVAVELKADVHMPILGIRDMSVDWGVVKPLIQQVLCNQHRLRVFTYQWK